VSDDRRHTHGTHIIMSSLVEERLPALREISTIPDFINACYQVKNRGGLAAELLVEVESRLNLIRVILAGFQHWAVEICYIAGSLSLMQGNFSGAVNYFNDTKTRLDRCTQDSNCGYSKERLKLLSLHSNAFLVLAMYFDVSKLDECRARIDTLSAICYNLNSADPLAILAKCAGVLVKVQHGGDAQSRWKLLQIAKDLLTVNASEETFFSGQEFCFVPARTLMDWATGFLRTMHQQVGVLNRQRKQHPAAAAIVLEEKDAIVKEAVLNERHKKFAEEQPRTNTNKRHSLDALVDALPTPFVKRPRKEEDPVPEKTADAENFAENQSLLPNPFQKPRSNVPEEKGLSETPEKAIHGAMNPFKVSSSPNVAAKQQTLELPPAPVLERADHRNCDVVQDVPTTTLFPRISTELAIANILVCVQAIKLNEDEVGPLRRQSDESRSEVIRLQQQLVESQKDNMVLKERLAKIKGMSSE